MTEAESNARIVYQRWLVEPATERRQPLIVEYRYWYHRIPLWRRLILRVAYWLAPIPPAEEQSNA